MADISVQMGVSGVAQFKNSMAQAQASVKNIDAQLKLNEKQFRATGDAQSYMQNKTNLLNTKLQAQKNAVKDAEDALKQMTENGIDPMSTAYQKMETQLLNAQSAMLDTQNDINNLGTESAEAAGKTDQLSNSLGGLNKKISLEQVTQAIGTITTNMEKAAQKAIELGKAIWDNITDSAEWADDTATQAMILNMDVEDYQRYKKVFDTVGELTVAEWQKAKQKVQKAINDPTQETTDILNLLGISTHEIQQGKYGAVQGAARDFEDVLWDIGETLRSKVASGEMTQDLADTYANALFGKSFSELNPLFALGREGFTEALAEQNVVTEDSVNKLAEMNDQLVKLKGDFETLQAEVVAGLAPALTKAAEVLDNLLGKLIEYLQTPEGKQALEDMGKAVEGLFSDLSNIDPQQVVEGFAGVFNGIVSGLQWVSDNSGTVIGALEAIVAGWAALKITGGALEIYKLIQGIMGLSGGAAAAGAAGAAAGASWGTGFANAVMAAAPWLIGIYTLLNPSDTAKGELFDTNTGMLTAEGWDDYLNNQENWAETIKEVGDIFGDMGKMATDWNAVNVMARYRMYGDEEALIRELEALGYTRKPSDDELKTKAPETSSVDSSGGMYDSQGNRIGYQMQQGGGVLYKDRRTGQIIPVIDPEEGSFGGMPVEDLPDDFFEFTAEPKVPEDAATKIAEEVGTVSVPVDLYLGGEEDGSHANGLWSVPFDGYRAILHKGERIVPAREAGNSRNFSSNLYVESMYMNNGADADGLAAAMAAAQRRTMAGYGS